MKKSSFRGFTLIEIAVALGILFLILAISTPFYLSYRTRTNVNQAAVITKALFERALEEAKTAGYPLPESLLESGLTTAATTTGGEGPISVHIRKRSTNGGNLTLVARRVIPGSESLELTLDGLGKLGLEESTDTGLYLEILRQTGGEMVVLATVPVDVNGDFLFLNKNAQASLAFKAGEHSREVQLTARGTVTTDQR